MVAEREHAGRLVGPRRGSPRHPIRSTRSGRGSRPSLVYRLLAVGDVLTPEGPIRAGGNLSCFDRHHWADRRTT